MQISNPVACVNAADAVNDCQMMSHSHVEI